MRDVTKVYYVFSAYKKGMSYINNLSNHGVALARLMKMGYSATSGEGTYLGNLENVILIEGLNSYDNVIKKLCLEYNQDCFLKIYHDNSVELVKMTGNPELVGKFIQVEEKDLKPTQDYSKFNNKYFVIQ